MFSMGADAVFACDVGSVSAGHHSSTIAAKVRIRSSSSLTIILQEILAIVFLVGGYLSTGGTHSRTHDTCQQSLKYKADWHSMYLYGYLLLRVR